MDPGRGRSHRTAGCLTKGRRQAMQEVLWDVVATARPPFVAVDKTVTRWTDAPWT